MRVTRRTRRGRRGGRGGARRWSAATPASRAGAASTAGSRPTRGRRGRSSSPSLYTGCLSQVWHTGLLPRPQLHLLRAGGPAELPRHRVRQEPGGFPFHTIQNMMFKLCVCRASHQTTARKATDKSRLSSSGTSLSNPPNLNTPNSPNSPNPPNIPIL
jgi:hypothetical protein